MFCDSRRRVVGQHQTSAPCADILGSLRLSLRRRFVQVLARLPFDPSLPGRRLVALLLAAADEEELDSLSLVGVDSYTGRPRPL